MDKQALSAITIFNKYAKFVPEANRRENWSEIVVRNKDMHKEKYPAMSHWIDKYYGEFVETKKALPSMRSLQFGGKPILMAHNRIFNCLAQDTEFVTSNGVKSFKDFAHGDGVMVLTDKGNWKPATVKSYGEQTLYQIKLARGRHQAEVVATANHRWLLEDGTVTTALKESDKLKALAPVFEEFSYDTASIDEQMYWCYGFVYGDGTVVNKGKPTQASMVRLCGPKAQYLERFTNTGFPHSFPPSCNLDPIVYTGKYFKTLPDSSTDPRLVRAFVAGYLDADGSKGTQLTLQASSTEAQEFIRTMFPVAGVFITRETAVTKDTNYGTNTGILFGLTKRFSEDRAHLFIVRSITELRRDTVWCLEVEDDASFVLASGAVTGNCAYAPLELTKFYSELMFLLLGGTGMGYSVQHRHVDRLPKVKTPESELEYKYQIQDSIIGWSDAIKIVSKAFFNAGTLPIFDYRDIREKGEDLITSGGKAPGPEPLRLCIESIIPIYRGAVGRRLSTLESHDISCLVADAVLAGGIRRAAMICLFDRDDEAMITCKSMAPVKAYFVNPKTAKQLEAAPEKQKQTVDWTNVYGVPGSADLDDYTVSQLVSTGKLPWYLPHPARGRANNSAVLKRGEVGEAEFRKLMVRIEESGCGEPGVFWTNNKDWGTNPCCEISLRPYQMCNLTEINAGALTDQASFNRASEAAAFLGTLQAGYTDFHYLNPRWKIACEKEALLGVSMTGIASGVVETLDCEEAAKCAIEMNKSVAALIGINPAARVTTVKPAGTTSLVLGTSSGIHAWHAPFYIRRMRAGKSEALAQYMQRAVPGLVEDDVTNPNQVVLSFPQKAPANATMRDEPMHSLLERVKSISSEWVGSGHISGVNRHNVSCTISVKGDEWGTLADWMWENRDYYSGISVMPYHGAAAYPQLPFEDISEEKYLEMLPLLEGIDIGQVFEDNGLGVDLKSELACSGGVCEII